MKAKLKTDFACAPDGVRVIEYRKGDIVEGEVARWAMAEGKAIAIRAAGDRPKGMGKAPENK